MDGLDEEFGMTVLLWAWVKNLENETVLSGCSESTRVGHLIVCLMY